jgi:hypothetical protein
VGPLSESSKDVIASAGLASRCGSIVMNKHDHCLCALASLARPGVRHWLLLWLLRWSGLRVGSAPGSKPATASALSPLQLLCCDGAGELVPWSQLSPEDDARGLGHLGTPWLPGAADVSASAGGQRC